GRHPVGGGPARAGHPHPRARGGGLPRRRQRAVFREVAAGLHDRSSRRGRRAAACRDRGPPGPALRRGRGGADGGAFGAHRARVSAVALQLPCGLARRPEERLMQPAEPDFTIGVEEEYLLVDKKTRALIVDPPKSLIGECEERIGGQVTSELLRSQIEVGTRVCHTVQEVRADLAKLRRGIIDVAARHGLAPIAASTHPFSRWSEQKQTPKERYDLLTAEMQAAARRLVICGMHVHVGISDEELRIDLMNQLSYFLPHLLALSCSSPFWDGHDTGLKSYRLTVFDALPRTGIPERFQSYAEYQRHVDVLINAGLIEDTTRIWWDLRPSGRFPTLETRIMDVCTRLDDAIALVSLLVCILRMLYRLRIAN